MLSYTLIKFNQPLEYFNFEELNTFLAKVDKKKIATFFLLPEKNYKTIKN